MTPRHLDKGIAVAFPPQRQAHRNYKLIRFDRRHHETGGKLCERQFAPSVRPRHRDNRIAGHCDRDQFGGRIKVAQRTADGAAVARLAMADLLQRLMHQRQPAVHQVGEFQLALARHRADLQRPIDLADIRQALYTVEIDEVIRQHIAHVEHWHQRLAAGEQLGVVQLRQQRHDLGFGPRIVIIKGRRLQLTIPSSLRRSTLPGNCPVWTALSTTTAPLTSTVVRLPAGY